MGRHIVRETIRPSTLFCGGDVPCARGAAALLAKRRFEQSHDLLADRLAPGEKPGPEHGVDGLELGENFICRIMTLQQTRMRPPVPRLLKRVEQIHAHIHAVQRDTQLVRTQPGKSEQLNRATSTLHQW
jgi:hypothetical protein